MTLNYAKFQERQGVPARWGDPARGTRKFPRPNRPRFRKATSRDPLLRRDPLPLAASQRGAEGGGGEGPRLEGGGLPARRGAGVPARGILRPIRGQEAWEYHEPGPPNEPGPLAFSQNYAKLH